MKVSARRIVEVELDQTEAAILADLLEVVSTTTTNHVSPAEAKLADTLARALRKELK